jgi:hypothetical protein
MKRRGARRAALIGALAAAGCLAPGCGAEPGQGPRAAGAFEVYGTVLEAATGEPMAGVLIRGPGGATATSDAGGRCARAVAGAGDLVAEGPAGLSAVNPLRPARGERLEVVLHLR